MAEIVNLRRERKRLARELEALKAERNRLRTGVLRKERELEAARKKLAERTLDGARRERGDGDA